MERECTHDLIVVIANQGSTDLVMDAAREAGATGGTVIHAKGTGTELVQKFFGVSIATEQEMIFILTRSETKKPIMKAVMAKAGINSAAQALISLCRWETSPACGSWIRRRTEERFQTGPPAAGPFFLSASCRREKFRSVWKFSAKRGGVSPVFQKIPRFF